jgi:hypothetical protein
MSKQVVNHPPSRLALSSTDNKENKKIATEIKIETEIKFNRAESWPQPQPIANALPAVEKLAPCLLPSPLAEWMCDVAERMQCPIDFIAVTTLVAIASLIGAGCAIRPKQRDNWQVIPNLWGGIVGRPGMLKTPAVSEVMQLFSLLEHDAKQQFDAKLAEYETALELYKSEKEAFKTELLAAQKQRVKNKAIEIENGPLVYKEYLLHLKAPEKPIWKRYKTNDATVEKLSELLAENPRGLLLYRDELMGLLAGWEREGRESDRAFFLEAWNGYGSLTTDRIARGTVFTQNLCLSIFGSTQPEKLNRYVNHALRSGENDGLLQRFQLLVYPDAPDNWQLIDREPHHHAKQQALQLFNALASMDFLQAGASKEADVRFPYFRFDAEAQQVFYTWLTELERVKLPNESHALMVEHLAKYRSLMPSLALLFHLVDIAAGQPKTTVSAESTLKATAWCDYLESHARRIYQLGNQMTTPAASKLAQKINEGKLGDGFTWRDIMRKGWELLSDKEVIQQACTELVDLNWLRVEPIPTVSYQQGRLPRYWINPLLRKSI